MAPPQIPSSTTASASLVVQPSDLASALPLSPEDAYPAVFATSRMIALMEIAAARILVPYLQPGELSVGVDVDAKHTAATPVGGKVEATAMFIGQEGKLYKFEITVKDEGGEVGRGVHRRAIVSKERIEKGAEGRRVVKM